MGWYQQRQTVQFIFIVLVGIVSVIVLLALLRLMLHAPVATWIALMGTVMVVAYVLMRAASFHHFDRFIGQRVLGLRWNWILEVSGIATVLFASIWRKATRPPTD